jgi:sugar-phosphatase
MSCSSTSSPNFEAHAAFPTFFLMALVDSSSPVRAIVFDLDGLLADSEPLWRKAEQEVFGSLGLELDEAALAETTGIRLDEVVRIRYRQKPWEGPSPKAVEGLIMDALDAHIDRSGKPMPGALAAVRDARQTGLPLALASSSPMRVIERQLTHLDIRDAFDAVHSAEKEAFGKPHPAVYLQAASSLSLPGRNCLALEDSLAGMVAAKAASMRVVVVPDKEVEGDPGFGLADWRFASLEALDHSFWNDLPR